MNKFPELQELLILEKMGIPSTQFKTLDVVNHKRNEYPITSIVIGSEDKSRPTFGLFDDFKIKYLHFTFEDL